jgi:VWFA-related protein
MMRSRLAPLLALLLLAGPVGLAAQEAPPPSPAPGEQVPPPLTFGVEVEQVVVDLVVTDKKGSAVTGISRDDLVIEEDGVPQSIVSFDGVVHSPDPRAEPVPPSKVSLNTEDPVEQGRTFVIVFDDMNLSPHRAHGAKAAVATFLRTAVREGDYVGLIATSGAAWWTARMTSGRDRLMDSLKRLDGRKVTDHSPERLTDWEAMRIHMHRDPQISRQALERFEKYGVHMQAQRDRHDPLTGTTSDPFLLARAEEVYTRARLGTRIALEVIERALNGLATVRGRKAVILVSEGFIADPHLDEFQRVDHAAVRANAAIYFLNARGLEELSGEFVSEFGPSVPGSDVSYAFASMSRVDDGSEAIAADSGGFTVKGVKNLDEGIQRIAEEARAYYLLGYVSTNEARDGAFREIEVKFKRGRGKGLEIRARKGYYAPLGAGTVAAQGREGVDAELQAVLDSPWVQDDIPIRMTHYLGGEQMMGTATAMIVAEVDIRSLSFTEEEGRHRAEIEFLMVVAHRESGEFFRYDQKINMRLRPATHERLNRIWFPIAREFDLGPGDHQARIIVRETASGRMGSVIHEFVVPELEGFRVSTPILSDQHRKDEDGQPTSPQPVARREFPRGAQLLCSFEIYGARKNERGLPEVTQGFEVRRTDGAVYSSLPPTPIQPTSIGALSRVFGFGLDRAQPGDYELVMTVVDTLSGERIDLSEAFTVVEAPPEPAAGAASQSASSAPAPPAIP